MDGQAVHPRFILALYQLYQLFSCTCVFICHGLPIHLSSSHVFVSFFSPLESPGMLTQSFPLYMQKKYKVVRYADRGRVVRPPSLSYGEISGGRRSQQVQNPSCQCSSAVL